MKKFWVSKWAAPTVILWITLLSFGILIPWLGLYADDWPFIYAFDLGGFSGVVQFIAWVRPFAGPFFALISALTGHTFWIAHVVVLALRFGDALLLAALLRLIWPSEKKLALWAALIFAIFPAFKQQPLAVEYFPHFVLLGLLLLSFIVMVRSVRKPGFNLLLPLSYVLSLGMFSVEYFFGQELLRPVLLWIELRRQGEHGWRLYKRVLFYWFPYLAVLLAFLVWRVFIQKFPTYQPSLLGRFFSAPLNTLLTLSGRVLTDIWTVAAGTWLQIFTSLPPGWRSLAAFGAVAAAAFIPVWILLMAQKDPSDPSVPAPSVSSARPWLTPLTWSGLGLFSMLLAGSLFWITDLPITLNFPWDRPTLAFILGSSLLTAGLLGLLQAGLVLFFKKIKTGSPFSASTLSAFIPVLILTLLVAFSCGQQFINANSYREEWDLMRTYYWQMAWRIPGLEPGTGIVMNDLPFAFAVDKFLDPLLEYTYAPNNQNPNLPYSILDYYKLGLKNPPPAGSPTPIDWGYGTLTFHGDSSRLVLVNFAPPACVRVLNPGDNRIFLLSKEFSALLPYSNPALIRQQGAAAAVPPPFLGPEPAHSWCYYFEQADWARQQGDWDQVVKLGDQAINKGFHAGQPSEALVFIEGYARRGNWEKARQLGSEMVKDDFYRPALCQLWSNLATDPALKTQAEIATKQSDCAK